VNVLSLFDGISAARVALDRAGIRIDRYLASEIKPHAIKIAQAMFPDMEQLGDITKIDFATLPPIDLIVFGSPCFPAGVMVLTDRGYIPIENIKLNDMVLTHTGKFRKVTATGHSLKETLLLKGNTDLETTENHPIYSADIDYYRPHRGKQVKKLVGVGNWTAADRMTGKRWATPREIEPLSIPLCGKPLDENLMYFTGRWLGDGWVNNGQRNNRPIGQHCNRIVLCDSLDKEKAVVDTVGQIHGRFCIVREMTVVKVMFTDEKLCAWLVDNFGKGALNKRIPAWVFGMDEKLRTAFLKGLTDSDGSVERNKIRYFSSSKALVLGVRFLGETLGYSTSVHYQKMKNTCVIEGRVCNQHNNYSVALVKSEKETNIIRGNHTWYKCRSVNKTGEVKEVYNLTVEGDNSYIADGIVVHNCQDLSCANNEQKGLDGLRSGLFYKAVEAVRVCKPRWFLMENVASMKKSEEEKISRTLGEFYTNDMFGIYCEPVRINSSLVSAQMRDRLYWCNWTVSQPADRHIMLQDVLDEDGEALVDKSYAVKSNLTPPHLGYSEKDGERLFNNSCTLVGKKNEKSYCLLASYAKRGEYDVNKPNCTDTFVGIRQRPHGYNHGGFFTEKSPSLTANGKFQDNNHVEVRKKAYCLGANYAKQNEQNFAKGQGELIQIGNIDAGKGAENNSIWSRVYDPQGKACTQNANGGGAGAKTGLYVIGEIVRKLTPRECCLLQTYDERVFDLFTMDRKSATPEKPYMSKSAWYNVFGDSFTVDVIVHILKCNRELMALC
jgi:site-specific DNA-cytosine methylase